MVAEVAAFGDVLHLAAGHDAFVLLFHDEIAQFCPAFPLGHGVKPLRQCSYGGLLFVIAAGNFNRQAGADEDLLHDGLQFSGYFATGFADVSRYLADKLVIRKFSGIAERFDRRRIGQDTMHDDDMAAAEGVHIPAGLRFFNQLDQPFLVRKDRIEGNFLQQADEFVDMLAQDFRLELEYGNVILVVFPIRKGRNGAVDTARMQVYQRCQFAVAVSFRIQVA